MSEQELKPFSLSFRIGSDKESGLIALQDYVDKYSKEVSIKYYDTKEKAIRAELIKLGWIPPEQVEKLVSLVEDCIGDLEYDLSCGPMLLEKMKTALTAYRKGME